MDLDNRLLDDLKTAMKSKDQKAVIAIRMLRAALKTEALNQRSPLTAEQQITVLSREAKRRKESLEMYQQGGREDLAEQEAFELEWIQRYLPEALTEEEMSALVEEAIRESGASGMKDMGRVMGILMPRLKGRADGKTVQNLVRNRLS